MATSFHPAPSGPHPDLASLAPLVGTWRVAGDAEGTVRYEWAEGGHFLLQHLDLVKDGHVIRGLELIGRLRGFGETPSADLRSRVYSYTDGLTLDYTYELRGDTLTIWGGERDSANYFEGRLGADGDTLTGGWRWPGGGYSVVSTRVA